MLYSSLFWVMRALSLKRSDMARVEQGDRTVLFATHTCSGLNELTELKPGPPVFRGPQK